MNKSRISSNSLKKKKASGYRKFTKTHQGRKILQMRRRKGRQVI